MKPNRRPIDIQTDAAYAKANDVEFDTLTTAWGGIVLAGGFFPVIVSLVGTVLLVLDQGIAEPLSQFDAEDLAIIPLLAVSFCIGLIYAAVVSAPAFLILQTFRFFSRWMLTDRGACGPFGGLTGFLCITGCGVFPYLETQGFDIEYFILIISAIAVGHFGAVYIGFRNRRKTLFPFTSPFLDANRRISIKFLMLVTAGFAIFVACCKAMGEIGIAFGVSWTCYAAFQFFLLIVERFVIKKLNIANDSAR